MAYNVVRLKRFDEGISKMSGLLFFFPYKHYKVDSNHEPHTIHTMGN